MLSANINFIIVFLIIASAVVLFLFQDPAIQNPTSVSDPQKNVCKHGRLFSWRVTAVFRRQPTGSF